MEPLPETTQAIDELGPGEEEDLLEELLDASEKVQELVPDCLGISITQLSDGIVLTLVATDVDTAVLDAVQYLAGGPCVDAIRAERVLEEQPDDLFDERGWQLFAQASAAKAVRSTLTLPIIREGRVTGSVNLYGGSGGSFTEHHQELAAIFGAWAPGAVANADLSFRTRDEARRAPERLADQRAVATATGIISEQLQVDLEAAREQLRQAALQASVEEAELARAVLESARSRSEDRPEPGRPEGLDEG